MIYIYIKKLLIIGLPWQCNYEVSAISSLTLSSDIDFIIDSSVSLEVKEGESLFFGSCSPPKLKSAGLVEESRGVGGAGYVTRGGDLGCEHGDCTWGDVGN